ncbi:hypothetical protein C8R43DRAFT_1045825, partial [Mycena crocata]
MRRIVVLGGWLFRHLVPVLRTLGSCRSCSPDVPQIILEFSGSLNAIDRHLTGVFDNHRLPLDIRCSSLPAMAM